MLAEYALIPDIFDSSKYDSPELCDVYLQTIKQPLLEEAIVRDLCDGNWQKCFNQDNVVLHMRAKELIKKLRTQNRLRQFPSVGMSSPHNGTEWCLEALLSHRKEPLTGIIATNCTVQQLNKNEMVLASIQKLNNVPWWKERNKWYNFF